MSDKRVNSVAVDVLDIEEHYDQAERLASMSLALEIAIFSKGYNYKEFEPAMSLFSDLMCDHAKAIKLLFDNAYGKDGKTA